MIEKVLVTHCAPTLAGLKTGSMFSCPCASGSGLLEEIRSLNRRLGAKGLRVLPLRIADARALVYVFRPKALERDLEDRAARELLRERGYRALGADACIRRLIARFREDGAFPHEVGIFLGYPPEDVCGFIRNGACGQKCTGCWKVYGDEAAAREKFARYKACTKTYCMQWEQGNTIERLAVAG